MDDLHLSFRLHDGERNSELESLLQLAAHLGYVYSVEIEVEDIGPHEMKTHYLWKYEVMLKGEYAVRVLEKGLKDILREDDEVQNAMNPADEKIIDLVQHINW